MESLQTDAGPRSIEIEVLVDGSDELHATDSGIYWVSYGAAKPGRHKGLDEPTYVNGKEWNPNWEEDRKDRGRDASAAYRLAIIPEILHFELLAIGSDRDAREIENRSEVVAKYEEDEERFTVNISDSQGGSRWYRFKLFYRNPLDFSEDNAPTSEIDIVQEYIQKRADGLKRLNEEYVADLSEVMEMALQEENLRMAERIKDKLETVRAETEALKESRVQ